MKSTTKKLIIDIVSYIAIGVAFFLAVIGLIIKFNNGTLYLFNVRADVVLSDSMSSKNEKYRDFLKGHDDQIQKFDLVFSSKVDREDQLEVYDIVLFNNPYIGTTMHRIVGKEVYKKDSFDLTLVETTSFNNEQVISMPEIGSQIASRDTISFTEVTLVFYSKNAYSDGYNFVAQNQEMTVNVATENLGSYYKHTLKATRDSSSPAKFLLVHKNYFDYEQDYIASLTMNAVKGDININAENIVKIEASYYYETNITYLYEIRGDKAPNSDGKFELKDIYSKVNVTAPKLGYFVRFITSIWGIVLLLGVGFIVIGTNILLERIKKMEGKNEAK